MIRAGAVLTARIKSIRSRAALRGRCYQPRGGQQVGPHRSMCFNRQSGFVGRLILLRGNEAGGISTNAFLQMSQQKA